MEGGSGGRGRAQFDALLRIEILPVQCLSFIVKEDWEFTSRYPLILKAGILTRRNEL